VIVSTGDRHTPDRVKIAFFEYHDVFEDFYPHYGVTQHEFATRWAGTGLHAYVATLQRDVGDVVWHAFSLAPELGSTRHTVMGCDVRFAQSSRLHRRLWRAYYTSSGWGTPSGAKRLHALYPVYEWLASYTSLPLWRTLRTLRRDRPDVLVVQDYATGRFDLLVLLARALQIPLVAIHAGSRPDLYVGKLAKRWTIRRADRIIVSNRDELEMLAQRYHVARDRLDLILTPIDTAVYRPMARQTACDVVGIDPGRRYVLFVGRLDDAVKRVSVLLGAFVRQLSRHATVDLLILGDGESGDALRRSAHRLPAGRVRFLGWESDPHRKACWYNAAECLVLPSTKEGFPTVVGEALASGIPVLGTSVGGIPELVVPDRTGWLVPPDDSDALAERLGFILEHPATVAAMRPQARQVAEARVSPSEVGAALQRCIATALAGRRRGG